jgi:Frataxin-like domain
MPVRRRRHPIGKGKGADDEPEEPRNRPLKHAAVEDDVEFVQAASALLDKLEAALAPMKPVNDFFVVERFFGDMGEVLTIDLGPKDGKYRVEMCLEDHIFEYSSPISGKILYVLSAETEEWVGMEDGHAFEGLLVRDLIRQCRGLPNF